ncbi:MAG: type VII toxin-antitoxin system MntA family adenylyltransferase antitoxin [Candidatus Woesearchaeota archaeon]
MNMKNSKKIKNLCKKYDVDLLILFGSRANNKHKNSSDYDIAFFSRNGLSNDDENILYKEIISVLNFEKLDLINLKKNHSVVLRNEIFSKGELIYESSEGLFKVIKTKVWMDYHDFKFDFGNQLKNIKRGIEKI